MVAKQKKLTVPQRKELERLAKTSPADNMVTGARVSRVRNSLRSLGLVRFFNPDGHKPGAFEILVHAGYGSPYELCEITDAGRRALQTPP